MTQSTGLRRRLAVGLAGAMLGAALIGGVAQVSADEDVNPVTERDQPADHQETDASAASALIVVQSQSAPILSDSTAMGPAQGVNQTQTRDDRNNGGDDN